MTVKTPRPVPDAASLRPETRLIHSGIMRSQFGENAETLYLTQSFVYDTAEQSAARLVERAIDEHLTCGTEHRAAGKRRGVWQLSAKRDHTCTGDRENPRTAACRENAGDDVAAIVVFARA